MHGLSVMRLARLVRSNVDGQLLPNGRSREAGAVAMLVAIFFGTGVLLGLGALVIDTGSLLYERRQLQSGADAAALSAAIVCAKADQAGTPCVPSAIAPSTLVGLAGLNAADGTSDVTSVCVSAAVLAANPTVFTAADLCASPPPAGLVECPNQSSTVGKYIEVRTSTRTVSNQTFLPPILAQTLAGGTYSGETVKACARVAWGPSMLHAPIIPFTPSLCDWGLDTGKGTTYPPNPPYTDATGTNPIDPTWEQALAFNAASDASCAAWQGHDFPGGFGWLTHSGSPACAVTVPADHWVPGDTGIGAANDCGSQIEAQVGHVVYMPIFDCASINKVWCDNVAVGSNTFYHMVKLAAFYITAVDVNGQVKKVSTLYPSVAAQAACAAKGGKCIYGWFLKKTYDPGAKIDPTGDPDAPIAVQMTG